MRRLFAEPYNRSRHSALKSTCPTLTRLVAPVQYAKQLTMVKRSASPQQRSVNLVAKVTPEQYELCQQRAAQCKVTLSAWIRSVCLQVASPPTQYGRPSKDGYIRIREPDGEMI